MGERDKTRLVFYLKRNFMVKIASNKKRSNSDFLLLTSEKYEIFIYWKG